MRFARPRSYYGFGIPRLLFLEAHRLRWVHSAAAGVGTALYRGDGRQRRGVHQFRGNSRHSDRRVRRRRACSTFCAGWTSSIDQQRRGEWNKTPFVRMDSVLREMDSVRALIVGVGGIGRRHGRATQRARRDVHRRSPAGRTGPHRRDSSASWGWISSTPSSRNTTSSCSRRRSPATRTGCSPRSGSTLLPPSAIVVNVARGALLDEEALAERLSKRAAARRGARCVQARSRWRRPVPSGGFGRFF